MNNPSDPAAENRVDYKALILLSFGHFVADLNGGALAALLPFLKEALHLSYAMTGTIVLYSTLTSSVVQPAFGYLTDRKSLLFFLPLGCFLATLGPALMGWVPSYALLMLLVVMSGIGSAIYHPEAWRNANFLAGEKKATAISVFAVGGNLGFACGPLMITSLIKYGGMKGTIYFMIPGILMAWFFPRSRIWRSRPRSQQISSSHSGADAGKAAIYPLTLLLGMVVARSWAYFGLITFIPFYFIHAMSGDPIRAGNLLFAYLAAGVVGTFVGGPLADRFGHKKMLLFSMGGTPFFLALFLLNSGAWAFFYLILAGLIMFLSFSISMVMAQSFMPRNVGMVSGLVLGLAVGTGGVGVSFFGFLADSWGVPSTLWLIICLPWLAFVLAALIPYPLSREARLPVARPAA